MKLWQRNKNCSKHMKSVTEIWKLWQRYKNCDKDIKIVTVKNVCAGHCTHHLHVETVPADQGQLWREFQTFQAQIHHYRFKFSTFDQMNWTRMCFTGSAEYLQLCEITFRGLIGFVGLEWGSGQWSQGFQRLSLFPSLTYFSLIQCQNSLKVEKSLRSSYSCTIFGGKF